MRHILHDWDDARCRTILDHCRRVMRPGSKLLIVETVIPPGNGPSFAKLLDLTMLVLPGGTERTEEEYRSLLGVSNFRLTRVIPTAAQVDVIEAAPV